MRRWLRFLQMARCGMQLAILADGLLACWRARWYWQASDLKRRLIILLLFIEARQKADFDRLLRPRGDTNYFMKPISSRKITPTSPLSFRHFAFTMYGRRAALYLFSRFRRAAMPSELSQDDTTHSRLLCINAEAWASALIGTGRNQWWRDTSYYLPLKWDDARMINEGWSPGGEKISTLHAFITAKSQLHTVVMRIESLKWADASYSRHRYRYRRRQPISDYISMRPK